MNIYNLVVRLISFLMLLICLIVVDGVLPCFAASVFLQWDPNTETDLAGYKVYYRTDDLGLPFDGVGAAEGSSPIDVHNWTTATINGLDPDRNYYFAITAYNFDGMESGFSNIVTISKSSPSIFPSIPFTHNDALLALRAAVGKVILSATETARLDVAPVIDGHSVPNGKVDVADAIVILSKIQAI